jgi:hypothetical protein
MGIRSLLTCETVSWPTWVPSGKVTELGATVSATPGRLDMVSVTGRLPPTVCALDVSRMGR